MKYEFIDEGIDNHILKYGDKEYKFKSTTEITSKMQSYIKNGRLKMIRDLAKDGMTIDDLIVEKKKDGKTYRDESNKIAYEKMYENDAMNEVFDEVCKETFGMDLVTLATDVGLTTEEEALKFGSKLMEKLLGQTPSTKQQ